MCNHYKSLQNQNFFVKSSEVAKTMCLCRTSEDVSALTSVLLLPFYIQPLWIFYSQPSLLRFEDMPITDVLYIPIMICSRFPRNWSDCSHFAIDAKLQNTILIWSFYSLPGQFSFWCLHTTVRMHSVPETWASSAKGTRKTPLLIPTTPNLVSWNDFTILMKYLKSQPTFLDHAIGSQTYAAVLKLCLSFCFCSFSVAGSVWDFWNYMSVIQC